MAREHTRQHNTTPVVHRRQSMRRWIGYVLRSFVYAFEGVWTMLRHQRNAQVHAGITLVVVGFGLGLGVNAGEWIALVLSIALVLALEAMNSALEAVVDLASPQLHPLAKRAKDMAAGAVLIGAIGAALVGLIIFLPKLWALAQRFL